MSGYAVTIFTAALAASFCACMSYGGKMKGATSAALCVLVLSVVISPLSLIGEISTDSIDKILEELDSLTDISEQDGYIGTVKETAEESLAGLVAEEFGLNADNVNINIQFSDDGKFSVEAVTVTLSGSAAFADGKSIAHYITENFGGECEVLLDF